MELKWSTNMIDDLVNIISYFKKNRIGEMIEVLADYFIMRHSKKLTLEKYTMNFIDSVDTDKIGENEYKLAFVCELVNSHANKKRKLKTLYKNKVKKEKFQDKADFTNVFNCLSFMIKYSISHNLDFRSNKPDNRIFFLISIIREKIFPNFVVKNKEDVDGLTLSYYLTSEIINIAQYNPEIVFQNSSLIANTENLDISICTNKQIREIMEIMKTKKTLFVRVLLVLAFEISKIPDILNPIWLQGYLKFIDYTEMISIFNSPLVEVLIFLTSRRIKSDEELIELYKMFD